MGISRQGHHFGGLLGSLQLLLRPGIEPNWRLSSSLCGEQAAPQATSLQMEARNFLPLEIANVQLLTDIYLDFFAFGKKKEPDIRP